MKIVDLLVLNHYGTKKACRKLIKKGCVSLDGRILSEDLIYTSGNVCVNGVLIDTHPLKYIMLNKPDGYVCDAKATNYKSVDELVSGLSYVGRLDHNTTGLLLLTNDFKLRKKLTLPSYHIVKVYAFSCAKPLSSLDVEKAKDGICIDHNVKCRPALIVLQDATHGTIRVTEGKYHEIRKMFLSLDNEIITLKRIAFGPLRLGDLKEGDSRPLEEKEIKALRECVL
jgi:16S rRNA pseudouridine516 synthase